MPAIIIITINSPSKPRYDDNHDEVDVDGDDNGDALIHINLYDLLTDSQVIS